jgi:adenosylhomocysteine nucleosidase
MHPVGIIGALEQELVVLRSLLSERSDLAIAGAAGRVSRGRLGPVPVVLATTGLGKVNAAMTVQRLICEHDIAALFLIGCAGRIDRQHLRVGDLVVAQRVFQHDYGYLGQTGLKHRRAGFMPEFGHGSEEDDVYHDLSEHWSAPVGAEFPARVAALGRSMASGLRARPDGAPPQVVLGVLASGDQFCDSVAQRQALERAGVDGVEMEGGAAAQVAHAHRLPCCLIRGLSDDAEQVNVGSLQEVLDGIAHNTAHLLSAVLAAGSLLPGLRRASAGRAG